MIKKTIYLAFIILFVSIAFQIYKVDLERRDLKREMATLVDEIELIEEDNQNLNEKIDFFSEPRNLEKELRARFNYRLPFEKLIIVIPENENQ